MVKICNTSSYPDSNELEYSKHFESFPYPLSPFQKHSIEGIVNGAHVLVTAHTGSGKTLPAEFAIEYFVSQGKKVIYTAPIKALSNQKFYEFQTKFPHISFGILTGDIKANPIADVLIMTTEILMNTLYLKSSSGNQVAGDFEMDLNLELGCVIFDEVHYINDADRGRVWEETIMMLPPHVQMVMLSATIDRPEEFGRWVEQTKGKELYLCSTSHRVVPLTHWSFITSNSSLEKKIKDKALIQEFHSWANKPQQLQSSTNVFSDLTHKTNKKFLDLLDDKQIRVTRPHVLNKVCEHMVEHSMLPALCFVLSRAQLEIAAHEITTGLLEFDSKVPYTAAYECEQIIRKLPNYREYLELPEYISMVKLIEKGIAIHHSGVLPVLKEMVELLYAKGFIKLLFATETFSIGVNMPTKTVLFTDLSKFDGSIVRPLYSHEYSQMAGRAGRRGIDTAGHVIHLINLFKTHPDNSTYRTIMCGKPQHLVSKFKIGYNLILNMIGIGLGSKSECLTYASKSMVSQELSNQARGLEQQIVQAKIQIGSGSVPKSEFANFVELGTRTPDTIICEYIDLQAGIKGLVNKKRKEAERRLQAIKDQYKFIDQDTSSYKLAQAKLAQVQELESQLDSTANYMGSNVDRVLSYLESKGFVELTSLLPDSNPSLEQNPKLTKLGQIATNIRETHCLVWSKIISEGLVTSPTLSVEDLIGFISCFTSLNVSDDYKCWNPSSCEELDSRPELKELITKTVDLYDEFAAEEQTHQIKSGLDYTIHFDLIELAIQWAGVQDVGEAKLLVSRLEETKKVFLGEFVKAILKIVNITHELEKVANAFGLVEFAHKLSQVPGLMLKFVATSQSLYI